MAETQEETIMDAEEDRKPQEPLQNGNDEAKPQNEKSEDAKVVTVASGHDSQQPQTEGGTVEVEGGFKSRYPTPANTAADATSERRRIKSAGPMSHPLYGRPIPVESSGGFPAVGSKLGNYFCLGQLGKGTFSSIHKCINLNYFHTNDHTNRRLAAAKVELSSFAQSGVLETEATVLEFLYKVLPERTVPVYMGHFKSGDYAAILMEYLPGEDMHQLREKVMEGTSSRRITVQDAVYLTADVILPLLQRVHQKGIVHRDVKPSNCVRYGGESKDFCLVDFGLSKSIVVPEDSPYADKAHRWKGKDWLKPNNYTGDAYYRQEREKAEFRGTSMYASLRIHQSNDYCPRDDVWSLLYVFCDLVSGGLPWMSYAANRDRDMCQKLKERIHGTAGEPDETQQLLYGDEFHVCYFKRERQKAAGEREERWIKLPRPQEMSKDEHKVDCLRKAFQHVAQLRFTDKPDYAFVASCIRGFLDNHSNFPVARPIEYSEPLISPPRRQSSESHPARKIPRWDLTLEIDPMNSDIFDSVEEEQETDPAVKKQDVSARSRLPIDLRYRLAQMEYNVINHHTIPPYLALRDWMKVVLPLLYDDWDAKSYEAGGHRTSTDGFQRDQYLELLKLCWEWAEEFNLFQDPECFFTSEGNGVSGGSHILEGSLKAQTKKRKINADSANVDFVNLSRALASLKAAIAEEGKKKPAPPARISFGGNL